MEDTRPWWRQPTGTPWKRRPPTKRSTLLTSIGEAVFGTYFLVIALFGPNDTITLVIRLAW